MKSPAKSTYRHQFKDGTVATLTLPEFDCQWSRKPTFAIAGEFFIWRCESIRHFQKQTGLPIEALNRMKNAHKWLRKHPGSMGAVMRWSLLTNGSGSILAAWAL
jgi:hypothetical protein